MRPADEPQVHIAPNSSLNGQRPGLIGIAIGTIMAEFEMYNVTPEFAIKLAGRLLDAASEVRVHVEDERT